MAALLAGLFLAALPLFGQAAGQVQTRGLVAQFPQTLAATVIGHPALASTISGAVKRSIYLKFKAVPGATWTYTLTDVRPLFPGQTETVNAMVDVNAPGSIEAYGPVFIKVNNDGPAMGDDKFLWFCNHPENLKGPGPLYSNVLEPEVPVRVLYHHISRNTSPLFMRMQLVNDSDAASRVLIVSGDGQPDENPVMAGLEAAVGFLKARVSGSGEVLDLPPHSRQVIAFRRMVMGTTMSGLCSLELLSGGAQSVNLTADSLDVASTDRSTQIALIDAKPWHLLAAQPVSPADTTGLSDYHLAYIRPYEDVTATVTAGGVGSDTRIGVEGIPRVGGGRALNGNYGVIYRYAVTLKNPTASARQFTFRYVGTTGYTAGLFLIDGKEYPQRPLQKGASRVFYRLSVPANSTVKLTLHAIPISGGIYPADLLIGS